MKCHKNTVLQISAAEYFTVNWSVILGLSTEEACCQTLSFAFDWFICETAGSEYKHNNILIKILHHCACTYHSLLGILAGMFEAIATCLCCATLT